MSKHIEQIVLKAVIPMEIYSTSLAIREQQITTAPRAYLTCQNTYYQEASKMADPVTAHLTSLTTHV